MTEAEIDRVVDESEVLAQVERAIEVIEGRARWAVLTGDCLPILAALPERCVDHVLADPPYDSQTHQRAKSSKGGGSDLAIDFAALGNLAHVAAQLRVTRRWVLDFCALGQLGDYAKAAGYLGPKNPGAWVRDGIWDRPDGTPQLTGDRPGQGAEGISILHNPGRKRWNGGGKRAVWRCGVERVERHSETPKPEKLICELLADFTDPGDLVLDSYAGGGTLGACALRMGRRAILIEIRPAMAQKCATRCAAEVSGVTLSAAEAGQLGLGLLP